MLELILSPVLLIAIYYIIKFNRMKNHDRILFEYCQLRRDIMSVLRRENFNLSKEDYSNYMEILDLLNSIIHYYNLHKQYTFRLKNLIRNLKEAKNKTNKIYKIKAKNNEDLERIRKQFIIITINAIIKNTPFFNSKIIFYLLKFSAQLMIAIIKNHSKKFIKDMAKIISYIKWIEHEAHSNNIKIGWI